MSDSKPPLYKPVKSLNNRHRSGPITIDTDFTTVKNLWCAGYLAWSGFMGWKIVKPY
jgi:hypothetical protein